MVSWSLGSELAQSHSRFPLLVKAGCQWSPDLRGGETVCISCWALWRYMTRQFTPEGMKNWLIWPDARPAEGFCGYAVLYELCFSEFPMYLWSWLPHLVGGIASHTAMNEWVGGHCFSVRPHWKTLLRLLLFTCLPPSSHCGLPACLLLSHYVTISKNNGVMGSSYCYGELVICSQASSFLVWVCCSP